VEGRRPWRIGTANNSCGFQRAKFSFCDLELIRIQDAGFGKNWPACRFNKMANAMPRPRRAFAVADNAERTAGTMCEMEAAILEGAAATARPTGSKEEANNTARENGSTNRR
jgi:hypothetical protein